MTTTDLAPALPQLSAQDRPTAEETRGRKLTFPRIVRSEWIKQQTLTSTRWTLLGLLVALVGFGMLAASSATGRTAAPGNGGGPNFSGQGPLAIVLSGANFATLIVAVLGTVVGAREYGSGLIRTTMAAVPSRLPVLWAKLLAFLGSVLPIVAVGIALAFAGGTAILNNAGAASVSWSDPGVVRVLGGQVAYLAGLGLIGVALGSVMRAIAGGLAVVLGGVLFVPALASALLPSGWTGALKYLPSNAGQSLTSLTTPTGLLDAGPAAAVLAAWVLGAIGLAAVLLRRRDV